jgi:hypothetical protein
LDHVRLRLRLARLADAAANAAVRGGGGAAAGVGHWEVATAQLLGAAEAFQRAPPEVGQRTVTAAAGAESDSGVTAAVAAAWLDARRGYESLLLAVLRSLVRSSKGGKRHAAHRELYSTALRSFKVRPRR